MLLKWILLTASLLLSNRVEAAAISSFECQSNQGSVICEIQLQGEVLAGEKLFLPTAQDADRLFFEDQQIGSTGHHLNNSFSAPFLPRVYSLQPLKGRVNPKLRLESYSFFHSSVAPPSRAQVIPPDYPFRRVYRALIAKCIGFLAVLLIAAFVIFSVRRTTIDGWTYPIDELRWFFGSLFVYMILDSDFSHLAVPALWDAAFHETCARLSLCVALWSLSSLILGVRFNDRSCVERGLNRRAHPAYGRVSDVAFILALFTSTFPITAGLSLPLSLQAIPLLLAVMASSRSLEWKRVLKRSGTSPLFFQFSLMLTGSIVIFTAVISAARSQHDSSAIRYSFILVLILAGWRIQRFLSARQRSRQLVRECRANLLLHSRGYDRLMALCEFIEDEWAAARVSIISVRGPLGLVIASAGPDAIPLGHHSRARKLGPFLRRVCREGHILYAPVAEELGKELQDQGMKHSSLAIPFTQQGKVGAVLCMMADEGERIPAIEAAVLELMAEELSLEILTAVAQHVAEDKCERLLVIARQADGIAVEHLDDWGHLQYEAKEEERVLVGAKLDPIFGHPGAGALRKAEKEFTRELRAIWHSLALSFEFVPKEIRDDFWVLSPKEFRNPFLKNLGLEQAALLLSLTMDRHARALAAKEGYLILAAPSTRIVAGRVKLHLVSHGAQTSGGLDIDSHDLEALHRIRENASASGPLFLNPSAQRADSSFRFRSTQVGMEAGKEIHSILSVTTDKKESRKIEAKALETAKESLKKIA